MLRTKAKQSQQLSALALPLDGGEKQSSCSRTRGTTWRPTLAENEQKHTSLSSVLSKPYSLDNPPTSILPPELSIVTILLVIVWMTVSDAMQYCPLRTLLHMQSCPGLCKNRMADMYMTVRA
jgi:hypothetical protein